MITKDVLMLNFYPFNINNNNASTNNNTYHNIDEETITIDKNLTKTNTIQVSKLILHNDDHNMFDYVMWCLMEYCDHSEDQAEQCVMITHNNGRCQIKSGSYNNMKVLKDILIECGLSVTIE